MKIATVSALLLIIAFFGYTSRQPISKFENVNASARRNQLSDSITVNLTSGSSNNELEFEDYFGNKLTLQKGANRLTYPILIKDIDWRHQTTFVFDKKIDSISFYKDSKGFFRVKTDSDKLDKELNFDVYYRRNISPILSPQWGRSRFVKDLYVHDVKSRKKDINTYFDSKSSYLESYRIEHSLSNRFLENWRTIIQYEKFAATLFIGTKYDLWPRSYLAELDKVIFDYNHDELLHLPMYRDGCIESLNLKAFLELGKVVSLSQYYEIAEKYYLGKTKDYLLLSLLLRSQDKYSTIKTTKVEYAQLVKKFVNNCQVREFVNYLSKSKLPDNFNSRKDQLLNSVRTVVSFSEISHPSTVNYIDFWASWCVPCRAEMPASKKLSEEYTPKGVNFIYISIDENPASWERAMNQIGLSTEKSFLFPYFKTSELYKKYTIATIPRYLLIDKKGNVINVDAPRPSDPMIREMFDDLLK